MNTKSLIYSFLVIAINVSVSFAQERQKDTLDDQVVNVVKPYTPTISDAFKIKDIPQLTDATTIEKKPVKYTIFSIPVASTFTPAKGKAASVDKAKKIKLYDNYASLGAGNFTNILGKLYLNHDINNTESAGGYFSHHSSQGGIDGVLLDDAFSVTSLNAHYSQKLRDLSWKIFAGADLQSFNWYGLFPSLFTQPEIDAIDPSHTFTSFNAGGQLNFEDSFINNANVLFRRFGDDNDSGENRFIAKAAFDIPVLDDGLKTKIYFDYLAGNFNRNYLTEDELNYGNITFGITPSYRIIEDDFTVDLGVELVYFNDTEFSETKFFVYPDVEASYRLVDEILIAYGGLKGGLLQNSYYDFATDNPFVSPTLFIAPTDQQYRGFLGFKGKLSNNVSYNVSGSFMSEDAKPLFKNNPAVVTPTQNYQFGNSYGVVYDNVTTLAIAGELNIDVNRNFSLGIRGQYFNYDTDAQSEAWNLPDITGAITLDYQISEKWFTGGSVFFTGERKDEINTTDISTVALVTLDSFFDANAHLGYRLNDRLSFLAKVNNIANQDYQRWANFPVQGIQFLVGATYQFDF